MNGVIWNTQNCVLIHLLCLFPSGVVNSEPRHQGAIKILWFHFSLAIHLYIRFMGDTVSATNLSVVIVVKQSIFIESSDYIFLHIHVDNRDCAIQRHSFKQLEQISWKLVRYCLFIVFNVPVWTIISYYLTRFPVIMSSTNSRMQDECLTNLCISPASCCWRSALCVQRAGWECTCVSMHAWVDCQYCQYFIFMPFFLSFFLSPCISHLFICRRLTVLIIALALAQHVLPKQDTEMEFEKEGVCGRL